MRLLALDCGQATGFAVGEPDGKPLVDTFRLPRVLDENIFGPRYAAFERHVEDLISVHQPDKVAFESTYAGALANQSYVRANLVYVGLAEKVAFQNGREPLEANVNSVRKHFCGTARVKDRDVINRCFDLGWPVADSHQADACALLSYWLHKLGFAPKRLVLTAPVRTAQ